MKRTLLCRLYPAAVLPCLWLCLPAMAQDSRIAGRITDATGAAQATAVVTATRLDSGSTRQVLSNAQGRFQLDRLPPGDYRIDVVKPGFKPLSRYGVGLSPGSTASVELRMEDAAVPGTVTESLLAYVCGLSVGSGCETFDTPLP